jgi:hypothetical protein
MTASRMLRLATLWQRKSGKTGKTYFSGYLADVQLLMFADGEVTRQNGEMNRTWKLLIQEKNPERRPQQRRDHGDQNQPVQNDAAGDGSTTVHRHERRDTREIATEAWAARFDERGPDMEPGF